MAGTNTFVGPVAVNAGTLQLGTAQALGYARGITVADGAVLDFNGKSAGAAGRAYDLTISGSGIGGTGAVVNNSATSIIPISSTLAGSGIRNVTLAADVTLGGNAAGHFDLANGGTITGNNHVLTKIGGNQVNLNGPATNLTSVVQAGSLYGAYPTSFGSSVTIKSGAKAGPAFAGDFTIPATVETGGTLDINSPLDATWSGPLTLGTSVNFSSSATTGALILPQDFNTASDITKTGAGTVRLTGTSTLTGALTVSAGTLALGNGGATGSVGTNPISVASGTTLEINRSDSFTLPNALNGAGGFRKTGLGSLVTTSVPSGALSVTVGSLTVDANVTVAAVSVSGGAKLRVAGTAAGTTVSSGPGTMLSIGTSSTPIGTLAATSFSLGAYATYDVEINTNSSTADRINVTGNITLNTASVLKVTNLGNTIPAAGTKFTILTYTGTLTGTFAGLPEGGTVKIGGLSYVIRYADGGKNITLTAPSPTPYQLWIAGYYPGVSDEAVIGENADADHDGLANMVEYVLGSDPASGLNTTEPYIQINGGTYQYYFLRSIAAGTAGYNSTVEYSQNLASGSWTTVTSEMLLVINNGDGTETVMASIPLPPGGKLFVRVRVTAP
ncbi:MAG: autotransporter-associated beta strand repeat-containing protein [Luteolibacter sp.]